MSLQKYFYTFEFQVEVFHTRTSDTDTEPEIKKKRIQKTNNTKSSKGKDVGKQNQKNM